MSFIDKDIAIIQTVDTGGGYCVHQCNGFSGKHANKSTSSDLKTNKMTWSSHFYAVYCQRDWYY